MWKKRLLCSLLLAAMLLGAAACGENEDSAAETQVTTAGAETEGETKPVYVEGMQTFEGYSFRFLNVIDNLWATDCMMLDFEEMPGDILNDAIYTRNRAVEEELEIKIADVVKYSIFDLITELQRSVMVDEDLYDAAYICTRDYAKAIDYAYNLWDVEALHLDQPWWSPSYVESMTIGNKYLYGSVDYINNWTQLYVSGLFFSKEMIRNYNMEMPYDLVREGNWTYETMEQMMLKVVNLNGDRNYSTQSGASCIFGHVSQHEEATLSLMQGSGEFIVVKDDDNMLTMKEDYSRLVDVFDRLIEIFSQEGINGLINTAEYMGCNIFWEGRALFHQENISKALGGMVREAEMDYGLLPMPKYNEEQTQYYTPVSQYGMVVTLPLTNPDVAKTGYILDYMNWKSYHDVYPDLQTSLCYKGLRDEDSIDMLDIIFDTKVGDIGFLWNISQELQTNLAKNIAAGRGQIASQLKSSSNNIEYSIAQYYDMFF